MLVKNQKVKVKWNGAHRKYYEEKGYPFTNYGDELEIDIKDLAPKSQKYVLVSCDYCGIPFMRRYCNYNTRKEKYGKDDKDCCDDCRVHKREETCLDKYGFKNAVQAEEIQNKIKETIKEKYGVEYISQAEEIKNKKKQTCLDRYGVEYTLQVPEIREMIIETNINKYGVENPFQNEEIKEKIRQVNMDKYGVEYPMQLPEIREKSQETTFKNLGVKYAMQSYKTQEKNKQSIQDKYGYTNIFQIPEIKEKIKKINIKKYGAENPLNNKEIREKANKTIKDKYGVDNVSQNPEIQAKIRRSFYKNGTTPTSIQQRYICFLVNGKLNFPIGRTNADILINNNIIIEYDGGGHNLSVKIGNITQDQFNRKEIKKYYFLKSKGYKIIRIVSAKDNLPKEEKRLIDAINIAIDYLNQNHSWFEINIDDGKLRCNCYEKDYNFGELRRGTKENLAINT